MNWLLNKRHAWIAWGAGHMPTSLAAVREAARAWASVGPGFSPLDDFNEAVEREIRKAFDAGYDAGRGS